MRCKDGYSVIAAIGLLSGVWAGEVSKSTKYLPSFEEENEAAWLRDWSENVSTNKTLDTAGTDTAGTVPSRRVRDCPQLCLTRLGQTPTLFDKP